MTKSLAKTSSKSKKLLTKNTNTMPYLLHFVTCPLLLFRKKLSMKKNLFISYVIAKI